MENKLTKTFIIIFGAIVLSFALSHSAFASYVTNYNYASSTDPVGYEYQPVVFNNNPVYPPYTGQNTYYQQQPVYVPTTTTITAKPTSSVVNNYYYSTAPATTKTSTTTTNTSASNPTLIPNTTTSNIPANTSGVNYNNGLGASAYTPYGNGITALSLKGSGGFLPSSVWQWIIVFFLILIIIIIARMFVHKQTPGEHTVVNHAH